jgi:hypothetical protein
MIGQQGRSAILFGPDSFQDHAFDESKRETDSRRWKMYREPDYAAVIAHDAERLAALHRLHGMGSTLALNEAVQYCLEWRVNPPRWVLEAVADRLASSALGKPPKKVGRAAGGLARDKMDMIHFARWDFVEDMKRARKEWMGELGELNKLPKSDQSAAIIARIEHEVRRIGATVDEVFRRASELLIGTSLAGSPEAIKSSFWRVERDFKHPVRRFRYYVFSHQTLRAVGLENVMCTTMPVKKFDEFLNSNS